MKRNKWHDIGLAIIVPDNHAPMKTRMKVAKVVKMLTGAILVSRVHSFFFLFWGPKSKAQRFNIKFDRIHQTEFNCTELLRKCTVDVSYNV